jgi:hypothetical protein
MGETYFSAIGGALLFAGAGLGIFAAAVAVIRARKDWGEAPMAAAILGAALIIAATMH